MRLVTIAFSGTLDDTLVPFYQQYVTILSDVDLLIHAVQAAKSDKRIGYPMRLPAIVYAAGISDEQAERLKKSNESIYFTWSKEQKL